MKMLSLLFSLFGYCCVFIYCVPVLHFLSWCSVPWAQLATKNNEPSQDNYNLCTRQKQKGKRDSKLGILHSSCAERRREWKAIFIACWTTAGVIMISFFQFLEAHFSRPIFPPRFHFVRVPRRSNTRSKANSFSVSRTYNDATVAIASRRVHRIRISLPTVGRGFDAPCDRLIKSDFPATLRSSPMHQTQAPPRTYVRGKVDGMRDGRWRKKPPGVGRSPMGKGGCREQKLYFDTKTYYRSRKVGSIYR